VAKKREWSKEFTPKKGHKAVNVNVNRVPPTLRAKFRAKCRREGKSQRNLLLGWIRNWVEDRRPDVDRPSDELGENLAHQAEAPADIANL